MRDSIIVASVLAGCLALPALAQGPERHEHHPSPKVGELGEVAFANSGAAAAQEPFLRGLALLHNFEYDEAAEGFREAERLDPSFAMAFWLEALTCSHLLWGEDDPDAARRALARLAPATDARLAKASTPRERAYGSAVEALFADGTLEERVTGFLAGMKKVAAANPDDLDAAAFTSLGLMFVDNNTKLPDDQHKAYQEEAISRADAVFRRNPQHPGGAHYLIHATDSPAFAARGLEAARRYAAIAPNAEHALHMPSHIFLQLGLWDDVVASNERSLAASQAEIKDRKLTTADLSYHALEWLHYAYLEQGRYRDARALIETARQAVSQADLAAPGSVDAHYTMGKLLFAQAAATNDWSGEVCSIAQPDTLVTKSEREAAFQARAGYQAAVAAVACGKTDASIDALRTRIAGMPANDFRTRVLKTALLHARLLTAIRKGAGTDLEDLIGEASPPGSPPIGPPPTLRNQELLGEVLLKAGRAREAVGAYRLALQLTPKRSEALLGLARACRAAGEASEAAEAYRQLLANWHRADAGITALDEARTGAKAN
jgi:tetratricopeptide (TPR) repeat protein